MYFKFKWLTLFVVKNFYKNFILASQQGSKGQPLRFSQPADILPYLPGQTAWYILKRWRVAGNLNKPREDKNWKVISKFGTSSELKERPF